MAGGGGWTMDFQDDGGTGDGPVLVHGDPPTGLDMRPVGGSEGHESDRGLAAWLERGRSLDPERGDADRTVPGG